MNQPLSALGLEVRKYDRERFVTALFAPQHRRDALLALYAFNAEVARIKSLVREPLAGSLRLQWWRDALTDQRPATEIDHHPIAGALARMVKSGQVSSQPLLSILDAREQDLDKSGFGTLAQLVDYVDATAGNLSFCSLELLGAADESSVKAGKGAAIAYGLVGLMRSLPANVSQGWQVLPADLVAAAGLNPDDITAKSDVGQPVRQILNHAQTVLNIARQSRIQRSALPVCLQGTLAHGHLRRLLRMGCNPFAAGLAQPHPMPLRLAVNALLGRF